MYRVAAIAALVAAATAQKVGSETAESHPKMSWQTCSADGTCTTVDGEVVLDANWRWLHEVGSNTLRLSCMKGLYSNS